jgi:hypothetical protein
MPRKSERITQRDLEVLTFIARYGTVPRAAVSSRVGTARSVTLARERRLRLAGLIESRLGFGPSERLLVATRSGLCACGRPELGVARPSPATVHHETVLARVAADLERGGERLLSEREINALERAEGVRHLSAALAGGRFHRADLIRLDAEGEPAEAIEVELTTKGAARLDAILRAWRLAVAERRVTRVVYHCTPRTRRVVERSIERTKTEAMIAVIDLRIRGRDGSHTHSV